MKKSLLTCALLALLSPVTQGDITVKTTSLTVAQIIAIKKTISVTPAAELAFVVNQLINQADHKVQIEVARLSLYIVSRQAPGAFDSILAAIPAEKRPPETPGNDNGNRPIVPPGQIKNYGSP